MNIYIDVNENFSLLGSINPHVYYNTNLLIVANSISMLMIEEIYICPRRHCFNSSVDRRRGVTIVTTRISCPVVSIIICVLNL